MPPPTYKVGDSVYYHGELHVVTQVKGVLGFNIYTCMNTNNGEFITSGRPGLHPAPASVFEDISPGDLPILPSTSSDVNPPTAPSTSSDGNKPETSSESSRFKQVSEADLVELQTSRVAKATHSSTKWGTKLFRGRFSLIIFKSINDLEK